MQRCSFLHKQSGSREALGRGQSLVGCDGPGLLSSHLELLPWGWALASLWKPVMSTEFTTEGKKDASQQICSVYLVKFVPSFLPCFVPAYNHRATTNSPPRLSWIIYVSPWDASSTRDSSCRMCVRHVSLRCYFLNKTACLAWRVDGWFGYWYLCPPSF